MKLVTAVVAPEVCFVLGRKKRTLMVVEPPRQFARSGVFEIDDNIFLGTEKIIADRLTRFVRQPFVFDLRRRIDVCAIEP